MSMKRNTRGQFIKGTNGTLFEGFGVWQDSKGYPCIWVDGKSIRIHVLVWERENGKKPKGFEIHHKDFNRVNYTIGNFELLSTSDHRKVHAGWLKGNGVWTFKPCNACNRILPLGEFYPRTGHTPTALCKPCHNEVIKRRQSTPEIQVRLKEYKHDYYERKKTTVA